MANRVGDSGRRVTRRTTFLSPVLNVVVWSTPSRGGLFQRPTDASLPELFQPTWDAMRPCRRSPLNQQRQRRGSVLIFTLFIIVVFLGMLALAIDLGYLMITRTEAQRTADAAAMAAAWELIHPGSLFGAPEYGAIANARNRATEYGQYNPLASRATTIDPNFGNYLSGDVVMGTLPTLTSTNMSFGDPSSYNAVTVRARRTASRHQEIALFFAPILGIRTAGMEAEATAALLRNIGGFRLEGPDAKNLDILPFALDEETWEDLLARRTSDQWSWDPDTETIRSGGDGIYEVNLYPQGTGSPGNRGTVDIGSNNNSTNDIARQILHGVSHSDLEYHGGKLEFDQYGKLMLNGDTGISAGVKDELASIRGKPRIIPIFRKVEGPGNNAMYTIVKFVGVRIMDVKLTGSMNTKRVIVQPAIVLTHGALPAPPGEQKSHYVYTRPILVK